MTMGTLDWAMRTRAPVSSTARLALFGIADSAQANGTAHVRIPDLAMDWTHRTETRTAEAVTELYSANVMSLVPWMTPVCGCESAHTLLHLPEWELTLASFLAPEPAQTTGRVPIPKWVRDAIMERDGYRCVHCGATDLLSIDHITPVSAGGSNEMDNLRVLCRPCNSSKGARDAVGAGRPVMA